MSADLQWDGDCVFWDGSLVGVVQHMPAVAPLPRNEAEERARQWYTQDTRAVALEAALAGKPEEYRANWSRTRFDRAISGYERCTTREAAVRAVLAGLAWTTSAERNDA